MEYRPYASRNLIARDIKIGQVSWKFVVDADAQRWIITKPLEVRILELSNGERTINGIMSRLRGFDPAVKNPQQLKDIIESLFYEGLLFNGQEEHLRQSSKIYNDTAIGAIHLEVTNACNLRCSHCYLNSGDKRPNELSLDEIKDIIDYLPAESGRKICISGGEPLMREDILEIIEYAAVTRGLTVDLYTNATLLDRQKVKKLRRLSDIAQYSINFQVSLEGADPLQNDTVRSKGAFNKVMSGIKLLTEYGMNKQIYLFICLTKNNIRDVPEMIKFAEELEVKALKFSQWQKQGRASGTSWGKMAPRLQDWLRAGEIILNYKNEKIFLTGNLYGDLRNGLDGSFRLTSPLFPKFNCHFKIAPRIDCEGNVWPCQLFVEPEFIVGNVREDHLDNIFSAQKYKSLFVKCAQRSAKVSVCAQCEWKGLCGCGCPGFAYSEYADLNYRDCFCEVRKYWFEEYIKSKINNLA